MKVFYSGSKPSHIEYKSKQLRAIRLVGLYMYRDPLLRHLPLLKRISRTPLILHLI